MIGACLPRGQAGGQPPADVMFMTDLYMATSCMHSAGVFWLLVQATQAVSNLSMMPALLQDTYMQPGL